MILLLFMSLQKIYRLSQNDWYFNAILAIFMIYAFFTILAFLPALLVSQNPNAKIVVVVVVISVAVILVVITANVVVVVVFVVVIDAGLVPPV